MGRLTRRQLLRIAGAGSIGGLTMHTASGTTALSGSTGTDGNAARVETRHPSALAQQAKLAADDGDRDDAFGGSVALSEDGTTAIVGAYADEDPNGENAGSAYVCSESGGTWRQQAKLTPDDGDKGDFFSGSVAVSGDGTTTIVGAPGDEDPNGENAGSAYVFRQSDSDGEPHTPTPDRTPTATPTPDRTGTPPRNGTVQTTSETSPRGPTVESSPTTDTTTPGTSGPGFGIAAALLALGSLVSVLTRSEDGDNT